MFVKLSYVKSILFLLSAMLVPMYFTDFRMPTGSVIIRLADIMALVIILLFIICYYFKSITIQLPKGYVFLSIFVVYNALNGYIQGEVVKTTISVFQWMMILSTLAIVYSQFLVKPDKFRGIFFRTLLFICFSVILYHFSIGKFYHYKSLGDAKYIFGLTGVLLLTHAYYYRSSRYLVPLLILYPFILLSLERKGILAFHVVLIFYACIFYKNMVLYLALFLFGSLLVALVVEPSIFNLSGFSLFEYEKYEILSLDEDKAVWNSNYHRQSLLTYGWDIFINNFWFGVGPKMLTFSMVDYFINSNLAFYTHNVFLDTLIEQGVVGFILLFSPYFIFLSTKTFSSRRESFSFVALIVYSVIMLFFMAGGGPSMILLYLPVFSGFIYKN